MAKSTREFKRLDTAVLDALFKDFCTAIGNVGALECGDMEETNQALEHVGMRLRNECCDCNGLGKAMLAKRILEVANTPD